MTRYALVGIDREANAEANRVLTQYLPVNYRLLTFTEDDGRPVALISGEDRAGWTLDGYVLPRLASGLYIGREVSADHPAVGQLANRALDEIANLLSADNWNADTLDAIYSVIAATGRTIGEL